MPSTHKKVIVRKHDRDSISGYVAPANFVVEGKLELLNTSGNVVAIDLREIKAVYFVREFSDTDLMLRKTFTTRPRTEGLWVRLKFKDSEVIEGILPNDLTQNPAEGFLSEPSRPALEHPARVRPPRSADISDGPSGNRSRQPPPQRRPARYPPSNPVRAVARRGRSSVPRAQFVWGRPPRPSKPSAARPSPRNKNRPHRKQAFRYNSPRHRHETSRHSQSPTSPHR